jgi:Uma2 family endonuclease
MNAVLVAPSQEWLDDRRRRGIDWQDEVWDGVLHVPPEPTSDHQRFEGRLERILIPLVELRGLEIFHQLSILDPRNHKKNYRIPDIVVIDPQHVLRRGTEGPVELAIEVLSPGDESRAKIPFYAARGVKELWLVDPETRAVEVYTLRGATYFTIVADRSGVIRAPALDLELSNVAGPKLRIAWADGSAEI